MLGFKANSQKYFHDLFLRELGDTLLQNEDGNYGNMDFWQSELPRRRKILKKGIYTYKIN